MTQAKETLWHRFEVTHVKLDSDSLFVADETHSLIGCIKQIPDTWTRWYVDFEDSAEVRDEDGEIVPGAFNCNARIIRHAHELNQGGQHEIIEFVRDDHGLVTARYLGPSDINATIHWTYGPGAII